MSGKGSGFKGQVALDALFIVLFLIVFAFAAFFLAKGYSDINDLIQSDTTLRNETKTAAANLDSNLPSTLDNAFLLALILLWFMLIVTTLFIDTHPIFFIVTVIVFIVSLAASVLLGNAYVEVMSQAENAAFALSFPVTNWVMNNLLTVILVIGGTTTIALFAKSQVG